VVGRHIYWEVPGERVVDQGWKFHSADSYVAIDFWNSDVRGLWLDIYLIAFVGMVVGAVGMYASKSGGSGDKAI